MFFHSRTTHPVLFALALLLAGCPAAHRPDNDGRGDLSFSLAAPNARSVAVAGSFSRWDPSRHLLSGPDRNGRWTVTLHLPPGRYEYLFVINGTEWVLDPAAPRVDDGIGGKNSLLVVPGPD